MQHDESKLKRPNESELEQTRSFSAPIAQSTEIRATTSLGDAAHESAPSIRQPLIDRLGHFDLVRILGEGTFGTVYLARDRNLDRDVALKIPRISASSPETDVRRFEREARVLAQIQHQNIVSVYEAGTIDDTYYISSAFVNGQTLRDVIREGKRFSPIEAAKVVCVLAEALHTAHNRGIIHRDIKPENIMIREDGKPMLMDFGLARRDNDNVLRTHEGAVIGTPAYMSPEQARGEGHDADARTDLWSLGVILYELLTGRRPFDGNFPALAAAIVKQEPISPRRLAGAIPRDLETICLTCLAKQVDGRYASAQHLADDLSRFLLHRPIQARATPTHERLWKWTRRNPMLASSLVLAGIIAVGYAIYWKTRPGYLDLRVTIENATVLLNGERLELHDQRILVARHPGNYRLEVSAPDFVSAEQDVFLHRGRNNATLVNFDLKSVYGYVEVTSDPVGAQICIVDPNGSVIDQGITPFRSTKVHSGRYKLTLDKEVYLPAEFDILVPNGLETLLVDPVELKPAFAHSRSFEQFLQVLKKLKQQPAADHDLTFFSTPLRDIIGKLSQEFDVRILLDFRTLRDLGITEDQPVSMQVSNLSLDSALKVLLAGRQLTYLPKYTEDRKCDIYIVSEKEAQRNLMNVIHPLDDLIDEAGSETHQQLLVRIRNSVPPHSWEITGGFGRLEMYNNVRAIHVINTWHVQVDVHNLLTELRRAKAGEIQSK